MATTDNINLDVFDGSTNVSLSVDSGNGLIPMGTEQIRIVSRGNANLYMNTTANWNRQPTYIPKRGDIIVYSDHDTVIEDGEEKIVPGIKIGDGMAYCIDLPFVTDSLAKRLLGHINNSAIHVSAEDRAFWDNKLNCDVDGEELYLNRL